MPGELRRQHRPEGHATIRRSHLAYAVDNGKLWLLLRPQTGATNSQIPLVTLETILLGTKPIQVEGGP